MPAQNYDTVFKSIFASRLTASLTGLNPVETLSTGFPTVQNRYLDLLLRLTGGSLLHLELQTRNDPP